MILNTTFTLVTWNANMAFHRKHELLTALSPDVAVVPECGTRARVSPLAPGFKPTDWRWTGKDTPMGRSKGLAVFSFGGTTLVPIEVPLLDRHFLVLDVRGPLPFTLVAVWPLPDASRSYVRPIQRTLSALDALLRKGPTVVLGDFNAGSGFLGGRTKGRFPDLAAQLEDLGLASAYHSHHSFPYGAEGEPTHFLHRSIEKPFHIDYVFVPRPWLSRIRSVTIGPASWLEHSDHVPVRMEIGLS